MKTRNLKRYNIKSPLKMGAGNFDSYTKGCEKFHFETSKTLTAKIRNTRLI
jgi:hypothetical protein